MVLRRLVPQRSPPPCGEGTGVGVVRESLPYDPPPPTLPHKGGSTSSLPRRRHQHHISHPRTIASCNPHGEHSVTGHGTHHDGKRRRAGHYVLGPRLRGDER